MELKTYGQVEVAAHETVRVPLEVPADSCSLVTTDGHRVVEPGRFDLLVGPSSRRSDLHSRRGTAGGERVSGGHRQDTRPRDGQVEALVPATLRSPRRLPSTLRSMPRDLGLIHDEASRLSQGCARSSRRQSSCRRRPVVGGLELPFEAMQYPSDARLTISCTRPRPVTDS
jgi:hypothetical protein